MKNLWGSNVCCHYKKIIKIMMAEFLTPTLRLNIQCFLQSGLPCTLNEIQQITRAQENLWWCTTAWFIAAPAQSSASLLQDKHLEVLKLLMTPAETQSRQSQPHFLDAVCQSGSWPEQTGGPVRVIGKKRVRERDERRQSREKRS